MGETEWSDWCQWKARCALGLCDRPTQGRLATFAMQRLRRYARRASGLTNLIDGADRRLPHDAAQAWHLFETHALAVLTREGKAYKEWLFARTQNTGDAPCDVVEAGASLMLRDVARRFLMNECLRPGTRSLDAPVTGSVDETLTYRDLLPDAMTPADALAARELDMMAAQEASALFGELSYRERIGLAAKLSGVPLHHPELLAHCGCARTRMHGVVRDGLSKLPARLHRRYPDESHDDLFSFATTILRRLEEVLFSWIHVEDVLPVLFPAAKESEP